MGLGGCGCCVSGEGLCLYVHIKTGAQRHQCTYQLGEVLAEALLPLRELAAALWWLCLWVSLWSLGDASATQGREGRPRGEPRGRTHQVVDAEEGDNGVDDEEAEGPVLGDERGEGLEHLHLCLVFVG